MSDQEMREKVINGLECCIKYPNEYGDCLGGDCPYGPRIGCHKELMRDALALLKAQEPVKPLKMAVDYVRKEPVVFSYECPMCMCGLQRHWVACPICGRAEKWE